MLAFFVGLTGTGRINNTRAEKTPINGALPHADEHLAACIQVHSQASELDDGNVAALAHQRDSVTVFAFLLVSDRDIDSGSHNIGRDICNPNGHIGCHTHSSPDGAARQQQANQQNGSDLTMAATPR